MPATRTSSGKLELHERLVQGGLGQDRTGDTDRPGDDAIGNIGEASRNRLPVGVHDQTRMVDRRPAEALHELERLRQDVLAVIRIANHVENNIRLAAEQIDIDRRIRDHAVEMTIIAGSASQISDRG